MTALVYPIASQKRSRDFDIPLSIIAGIFVFAAVAIQLPFCECERGIGRMGGDLLLVMFCYFLYNTFRHAKDHPEEMQNEEEQAAKVLTVRRAIALILVGFIGLIVGGELIVKSAVNIAERCGVSHTIVSAVLNRPWVRWRCSKEK